MTSFARCWRPCRSSENIIRKKGWNQGTLQRAWLTRFPGFCSGREHLGNAGIVTHKVQMLAPAGSSRSRFRVVTLFATNTYLLPFIWFHGCTISSRSPEPMGRVWGPTLTVIYSTECVAPRTKLRPAALLPLLVILFIVSYGILTMLVFEQGQTIESQRSLIREMLKDSTQLATLKGKLARDDSKRVHEKASAPADQKAADQKTADQKAADPGNPAAGVKGSDKETKRPGKSAHSMKEVPGKPAADLEDVRRSTRVI
jgi:hypothetical protein